MIQQVKKSKFKKTVAIYLAMMILLETFQPMQMYALTSGPTQPEFNSFTPIGTSDMVNLASGDFNYNIPIMDVGGYPLNLAYNSGITMDQEASWVGLGWNLNVGEISRQVRGLPDDFRDDKVLYENDMRDNVTVGTNLNASPAFFGKDFPFSLGLGVQYNNYEGITFKPSIGVSFSLSDNTNVGIDLSGSTAEGATLSPSVSISKQLKFKSDASIGLNGGSIGSSLSSRKGLENISISAPLMIKNQSLPLRSSYFFNNTNNYTPTKRVAFDNINSTFNASFGTEFYGAEIQTRITGYGSVQKINSKFKKRSVGAYGYENTQYKNNSEGVLDFNREKEQTISKNTNILPVTNYTYDVYNIEGQGISGMFRPYRSQSTYVYNDKVTDFSISGTFGAEIGAGNLFHAGVNFAVSPSTSSTGKWSKRNNAQAVFSESNTDKNDPLYEQSTFKLVGELNVDNESEIYLNKMLGSEPINLKVDGSAYNRKLNPVFRGKLTGEAPRLTNTSLKRKERVLRNQSIQKVTNKEADSIFVFKNDYARPNHTVGIKVLQADGSSYIYGRSVYNTKKVEATFDVSNATNKIDVNRGSISYNGSLSGNGNSNSDHYINKITTPGYAHTYLITSVLSSDYKDIDNNGPTDTDLGTYTKFDYTKAGDKGFVPDYKWRVPYNKNEASYNEGLKTSKKDQKGNYIYGTKELTYLKKIETKTHVAFIDLQDRKDAMGVAEEHGGQGTQAMSCIKSIRLYSKSELQNVKGIVIDPGVQSNIKPIKTAHFEYSYELCDDTPSNFLGKRSVNGEVGSKGKLTLKKLYFTYRGSNMGKYTPYKFHYSESYTKANIDNPNQTVVVPFDYDAKGFDIWGNFNENLRSSPLNTTEFPFVNQDKKEADSKTSAWTLNKIVLPSGGEMNILTESDDYKFVQNKKAMQMFKVIGAGDDKIPPANPNGQLYNHIKHNDYIYVKISDRSLTSKEFVNKYLLENINNPIYFKFMLNMTDQSSDYVSGYFEIDKAKIDNIVVINNIASIPLKFLKRDGGINGKGSVNPISKAGWGFGRTYLNRSVYSIGGDETNKSFISIVKDLVQSIKAVTEIYKGPNGVLEKKGCARNFDTNRSWIRLENPNGRKLGGGLRVKRIELSDNWIVLNSVEKNSVYNEKYGQDYSYTLEDGTSSGVATFEPNASPENPFVLPFYGKDGNYADKIGSPKEMNYVEKPFGESFFPSPKITYSRVTVTNLDKSGDNGSKIIKKHATGKIITEHYTTHDFPTLVDYTDLDIRADQMKSPLLKILNVFSIDHLTASQGFSIETNDMDGKVKSEQVYGEGATTPVSKVVYKYNIGTNGKLDNNLTTINSKGKTEVKMIGVDYDLINDFNESHTLSQTFGADGNLASFLMAIFPIIVPTVFPRYARHESILRTATTTKVVHKTGILIEKIAFDLGSKVSTKNLAWDATSGQVLLTQTISEFDDNYFIFNYPAYWNYENMGLASENIDLNGELIHNESYFNIKNLSTVDISKYFKIGDELIVGENNRLWVNGYNVDKKQIQLINKNGTIINQSNLPSNLTFKVVRSGNRNQQMISMASVTTMINPIDKDGNKILENIDDKTFGYSANSTFDQKVINANAVEYSDDWKSQCENGLPNVSGFLSSSATLVNPFLYNIKGNWKAVKSYAFLAGRNNFKTTNRRSAGYFTKFNPFYTVNVNGIWSINKVGWTFASEVTKYSPYGLELENKDALQRYSSAQYGYNYKLPVAVSSNSKYNEMGFDGFEDYGIPNPLLDALKNPHFGFGQTLNDGATISKLKSHTGNNSLEVKAGKKATFTRKINGCKVSTSPIICKANVNVSPVSQVISSGQSTSIRLTSTVTGTTFKWTVDQSPGISGATAGNGDLIEQVLANNSNSARVVTYNITPMLGNCSGPVTSYSVIVNPNNIECFLYEIAGGPNGTTVTFTSCEGVYETVSIPAGTVYRFCSSSGAAGAGLLGSCYADLKSSR